MIKALLKRYKYPPDQEVAAIELVLQQTEMISEEWSRDADPITFQLVGDHIEVRHHRQEQVVSTSGFGMLHSQRPPVPAHFDPANLLEP
jgi:hypothetical protein